MSIFQKVEWNFTAAGLSGIFTRFPFNPVICLNNQNQFGCEDIINSLNKKPDIGI